jgi:hypothetical protein
MTSHCSNILLQTAKNTRADVHLILRVFPPEMERRCIIECQRQMVWENLLLGAPKINFLNIFTSFKNTILQIEMGILSDLIFGLATRKKKCYNS